MSAMTNQNRVQGQEKRCEFSDIRSGSQRRGPQIRAALGGAEVPSPEILSF
jgi:hypothetical protein